MQVLQLLGLALLGYLIGSIPSGWLVVRLLRGRDLRVEGSGNIGTANVYRSAGALPAILTFLGDILKGAIPVLLGYLAGYLLGSFELALIGLMPVIGHTWPVFLKFRGG
jgi:glycerol-3-phosphate acyltransferase PlsY